MSTSRNSLTFGSFDQLSVSLLVLSSPLRAVSHGFLRDKNSCQFTDTESEKARKLSGEREKAEKSLELQGEKLRRAFSAPKALSVENRGSFL